MNSSLYFNTIASDWNALRNQYFKDDIRPMMHATLDFKNKKVVDLGSGTGFIALEASKTASHVFALDQSAKMLETIDAHELDNVTTILGPITSIPLAPESVDVVTINMALHHISDPLLLMKEVHRILKPGGEFFISDVMEHDGTWAHDEMYDVWLGFTLNQINTWLALAEFKEINTINTNLRATAVSNANNIIKTTIFMSISKKEQK